MAACSRPWRPTSTPPPPCVLDAAGIQVVLEPGPAAAARCSHLSDPQGGLDDMRRNVDAWWPLIERGSVEAIDECLGLRTGGEGIRPRAGARPGLAPIARRISELARDLSELLPDLVAAPAGPAGRREAATGRVSPALHAAARPEAARRRREPAARAGLRGRDRRRGKPPVLGSAGTHVSRLQPELSYSLRDRKLGHLAKRRRDRQRHMAASSTCSPAHGRRSDTGSNCRPGLAELKIKSAGEASHPRVVRRRLRASPRRCSACRVLMSQVLRTQFCALITS